jgi:PAS domain S-box-containing protein
VTTISPQDLGIGQLFHHIRDAVVVADARSGRIVLWNAQATEIFGYSESEALDLPLERLVPERLRERYLAGIAGYRDTGRDRPIDTGNVLDLPVLHKDGSELQVELTLSPIENPPAGGRYVLAVIRDVTQRGRVADALRESEERFAKAFRANPGAMSISGLEDGRFIDVNDSFLELLGYGREEVIGRTSVELNMLESREERQRVIGRMERRGSVHDVEVTLRTKSGERRDVLSRVEPIELGGQTYALTLIQDITERKRAFAELERLYREAERARGQARAILDATGEGMVLVSPEREFLAANQRFAELFGVALDEVLGRHFADLGGLVERIFSDPEGFRRRVTGTASDRELQFTETLVQRWPVARELELFSTPVHDSGGEFLGRLYVFRDLTREREVDQMKREFVSVVSHELRTPLTSIKGYVDLILDGYAGEVQATQREFLEIIQRSGDRLVAIVNDLLDVSRIESGRIQLERGRLDLAALLRETADLLLPQIVEKGQELAVDLPETLPEVWADRGRVSQVLSNLLSNAHKYTPADGRIYLSARAEPGRVRVVVRDTGIGLTAEEQTKLFTKFFRSQHELVRDQTGTGLGLVITRSLIELHGGELTVESAPGKGSTFGFTLPLADLPA